MNSSSEHMVGAEEFAATKATAGCLLDAANRYLAAGISVIPCRRVGGDKRPLVGWTEYTERRPTPQELETWFGRPSASTAMAIVCGKASGNVEVIDFDCGGEDFEPWRNHVRSLAPGLLDRLVVQRTPSGGAHVLYRTGGSVPRSRKLACKRVETDEPSVERYGKRYATVAAPDGDRCATITSIETRGEGGIALCCPSVGYGLLQGAISDLPLISSQDRDTLVKAAMSFDQRLRSAEPARAAGPSSGQPEWARNRPGDDYNRRGDVHSVLVRAGWTFVETADDGNEHWCRQGKVKGTSATFNGSHFYVFSTNAPPFEPDTQYTPFAVYALLEHGGDFGVAARELARLGYGDGGPALADEVAASMIIPAVRVVSAVELARSRPVMRPVVVEGLLRSGEVMNLVAPPKIGKSWLAAWLTMAVAVGADWLSGFRAHRHPALLVDNELHEETLASRLRELADANGIDLDETRDFLHVLSLRGAQVGRDPLWEIEDASKSVRPGLIVVDALYRALPVGTDENDNAAVTAVYSRLVRLAATTGAAVVVVHHTSKGDQRFRAVTDVGAGAGAQSRACDSHVILRPGNGEGVAVMDLALRSFESRTGIVLRFVRPRWSVDPTVRAGTSSEERTAPEITSPTAERFAREVVGSAWLTREEIESASHGLSKREAWGLVQRGVKDGLLVRKQPSRRVRATFSCATPP
ncbi:MAG: AAA family ATPase [Phycisphaerae bacterium]|nr:AAA family ATPase [Phycisphaerae bacterium]